MERKASPCVWAESIFSNGARECFEIVPERCGIQLPCEVAEEKFGVGLGVPGASDQDSIVSVLVDEESRFDTLTCGIGAEHGVLLCGWISRMIRRDRWRPIERGILDGPVRANERVSRAQLIANACK